MNQAIIKTIKKLWYFFPLKTKIEFCIAIFIMLLSSFAEIISIASILFF